MEIIVQMWLFLLLENARVNEISSDRHYMWLDWISSIQNIQMFYFGSDHVHMPLRSGYDEMLKFQTTLSSSWEAMAAEQEAGRVGNPRWGRSRECQTYLTDAEALERSGKVYIHCSCSIANTESASKAPAFALHCFLWIISQKPERYLIL